MSVLCTSCGHPLACKCVRSAMPRETLERVLQVVTETASMLDDYEWTGIDEWCVEGCRGCKHHGHNEGCALVAHQAELAAVKRDLEALSQ